MAYYYVRINGKDVGPLSQLELNDLHISGEINVTTPVILTNSYNPNKPWENVWQKLDQVLASTSNNKEDVIFRCFFCSSLISVSVNDLLEMSSCPECKATYKLSAQKLDQQVAHDQNKATDNQPPQKIKQWYYSKSGDRKGPIDDATLIRLFKSRWLNFETLVWIEGMDNWNKALDVKDLLPPEILAIPQEEKKDQPPPLPEIAKKIEPPILPNKISPNIPLSKSISANPQLELASKSQRFWTYFFDLIFFIIFMWISLFGLFVMGLRDLTWNMSGLTSYVYAFFLSLLYYIPQEVTSGRTLGKHLTGTQAVSEDGSKLTFGQALGRTLCRCIPFEAISFLFGSGGPRGWHDKIPGTKVVSLKRKL